MGAVLAPDDQIHALDQELKPLVTQLAPHLPAICGCATLTAAMFVLRLFLGSVDKNRGLTGPAPSGMTEEQGNATRRPGRTRLRAILEQPRRTEV